MADENVYVYTLDIEFPEGAEDPTWVPDRWMERWENGWSPEATPRFNVAPGAFYNNEQGEEIASSYAMNPDGSFQFFWPRQRNFLHRATAYKHAARFTRWGAKVKVVRSKPVEWEKEPAEFPDGVRGRKQQYRKQQQKLAEANMATIMERLNA